MFGNYSKNRTLPGSGPRAMLRQGAGWSNIPCSTAETGTFTLDRESLRWTENPFSVQVPRKD